MPDLDLFLRGYRYASLVLNTWRKENVSFLIEAVDVYKSIALQDNNPHALGIAAWIWERVLEKEAA